MTIKLHASIVVHPSRWLKTEVIDHLAVSKTRVAEHLGVTRPAMSNLLNGKAALSLDGDPRREGFGASGGDNAADVGTAGLGAGCVARGRDQGRAVAGDCLMTAMCLITMVFREICGIDP